MSDEVQFMNMCALISLSPSILPAMCATGGIEKEAKTNSPAELVDTDALGGFSHRMCNGRFEKKVHIAEKLPSMKLKDDMQT